MPCNSDYLSQNGRESELQRTAELLEWALSELGLPADQAVSRAAETYYCAADFVPNLCALLCGLPEDLRDTLLSRRHKMSRELKEWWEEHVIADRERKALEQRRAKARNKLTPQELADLEL